MKGFDQLVNLVLDDCVEYLKPSAAPVAAAGGVAAPAADASATRNLGLLVVRGPNVSSLSPEDGHEEIANPFAEPADEK